MEMDQQTEELFRQARTSLDAVGVALAAARDAVALVDAKTIGDGRVHQAFKVLLATVNEADDIRQHAGRLVSETIEETFLPNISAALRRPA